jgi:DNA invertase Pin-like site-specific DNA recombinase
MKTAIAYIRVSTQKQGKSGLGIEAQTAAINADAAANDFEIIATFVEIETGKGADALDKRPELATVLEVARLTGATIMVAKLDRLTRSVHFGSGLLLDGKQVFRVADQPSANNFMLHILLCFAEKERQDISDRTVAALSAAKGRGTKLGSPTTPGILKDRSAAFAANLKAIVEPMLGQSSRTIAAALNDRGIATATGGTWSSATVRRLINRLNPELEAA